MTVDKKISEAIPEILKKLNQNSGTDLSAFVGFDACIDNIVRIVKDKRTGENPGYFDTSSDFGEFLLYLSNKSCGVELNTKLSKPGGNMVITGNGLGNLGINVDCVGTFGLPDILPIFRSMSPNCTLHSIGETITATALEFNNSKVIMFDPGTYNNLTWEDIKKYIGVENLGAMLSGKQLVSFLNWSEIENSSMIWKGIINEILPLYINSDKKSLFFTDLSDCSRRSKKEIQYALDLLGKFRKYFRVIISLNKNEAELVAKAMCVPVSGSGEKFIKSLFNAIDADILLIHQVNDALAFDGMAFENCDTFFCSEPVILTGGGDNFNAGFCYAQLKNLNLYQSLLVANAVSGSYVKTGFSPSEEGLKEFLSFQVTANHV